MSENPKIGILPPGPISNDDLFIKVSDGKDIQTEIRESLELNKHYRGVNKEVWHIFHRMYGGGPIIVRDELDIYSKDLSKELSARSAPRGKEISIPIRQSGNSGSRVPGANNIFAKNSNS